MNLAGQPKECVIGFDVLARSVGAIGRCHARLLNLRTRSPLSGRFLRGTPELKPWAMIYNRFAVFSNSLANIIAGTSASA
jgi:hypothetical protein